VNINARTDTIPSKRPNDATSDIGARYRILRTRDVAKKIGNGQSIISRISGAVVMLINVTLLAGNRVIISTVETAGTAVTELEKVGSVSAVAFENVTLLYDANVNTGWVDIDSTRLGTTRF